MRIKIIEIVPIEGHEPSIEDMALIEQVNEMDQYDYDFSTYKKISHPIYREKARQRIKQLYRLEEDSCGCA